VITPPLGQDKKRSDKLPGIKAALTILKVFVSGAFPGPERSDHLE
jgi:hypothetical protein